MQTAWITGCHGFAGRYLVHELAGRGYRVVGIDRPESEAPEGLPAEPRVLDLSDGDAVAEALRADAPTHLFHLAAQSSGALSFTQPRETFRSNVESTLGLLEGLRALRAEGRRPRLLAVGSCEEYGAPERLPIDEDHPLHPASPYAVSKAAQTLLCEQYRRAHDLDLICTRSFTHTGPGQSDRFVFSSFARQIAELERNGGGTLKVGNLEVSRDVSDVRDVVRAYADLAEAKTKHSVMNVCSGRETHLRGALDLLLSKARAPIEVELDPSRLRPADVPRFVGDPTRLERTVGWVPETPLEQTLDELLNWWRDRAGGAKGR